MDPIEEQRELMSIWVSALRLSRRNPRLAAWLLCGVGSRALIATETVDPKEIVDLVYQIARDAEVET